MAEADGSMICSLEIRTFRSEKKEVAVVSPPYGPATIRDLMDASGSPTDDIAFVIKTWNDGKRWEKSTIDERAFADEKYLIYKRDVSPVTKTDKPHVFAFMWMQTSGASGWSLSIDGTTITRALRSNVLGSFDAYWLATWIGHFMGGLKLWEIIRFGRKSPLMAPPRSVKDFMSLISQY